MLSDLAGHIGDWTTSAACRGADPNIFFPERGEPGDKAKRVCVHCSVRLDCLAYAMGNKERHGVWGGLTERERRRLSKLPEFARRVASGEAMHTVLADLAPVEIGRGKRRRAA